MKPAVAIVGPGKVGSALGRRLYTAGYPLSALYARDLQKGLKAAAFIGCPVEIVTRELQPLAAAELILLCLPDDQLQQFSSRLCRELGLGDEATLIHCSGLHPASILAPGEQIGRLSLHPLLPFADSASAAEQLAGCPFALEGDEDRLRLGTELIDAIGGRPFNLPSHAKHLYHTAASLASNFLVSLTDGACALLAECGLEESEALALLAPLQQATLQNIQRFGPAPALTGPIVRGDTGTVARQLHAITAQAPEQVDLYRSLAGATLGLAVRSGRLSAQKAEPIRQLIEE